MSSVLSFAYQFDSSITCSKCGVPVVLPVEYVRKRRADHATFYCPNGHEQYFPAESEAEKLRKQLGGKNLQLQWALQREDDLRKQRENLTRRLNGTKGALTKVKRRIAGGCCPCCKRSFADLRRHMTSKHPGFSTKKEE